MTSSRSVNFNSIDLWPLPPQSGFKFNSVASASLKSEDTPIAKATKKLTQESIHGALCSFGLCRDKVPQPQLYCTLILLTNRLLSDSGRGFGFRTKGVLFESLSQIRHERRCEVHLTYCLVQLSVALTKRGIAQAVLPLYDMGRHYICQQSEYNWNILIFHS